MEREERYIVIKKSDLQAALANKRLDQVHEANLVDLIERLATQRFVNNKKALNCVVVESDWPEYERVWKMIEARVDDHVEENYEQLKRKAAMFDNLRDLMGYVQNGTSQTVKMFQDDATMWFSVVIEGCGKRFGESAPNLEDAIRRMHHKYGGE